MNRFYYGTRDIMDRKLLLDRLVVLVKKGYFNFAAAKQISSPYNYLTFNSQSNGYVELRFQAQMFNQDQNILHQLMAYFRQLFEEEVLQNPYSNQNGNSVIHPFLPVFSQAILKEFELAINLKAESVDKNSLNDDQRIFNTVYSSDRVIKPGGGKNNNGHRFFKSTFKAYNLVTRLLAQNQYKHSEILGLKYPERFEATLQKSRRYSKPFFCKIEKVSLRFPCPNTASQQAMFHPFP